MPVPTPDDFWRSLVHTGLLTAEAAAAARAEHASLPPAEAGDGSAGAIAAWLVRRGGISRWQARRLANGDAGPFFLGEYRLLERLERRGDGLLFAARHEPSARQVWLVLLNARRCRELEVWTSIVERAEVACRAADPTTSRTWALERRDGVRFLVCEPVSGANLADELERLGPLPPRRAAMLVSQVARAVAELHALGGIHGHLSPAALRRESGPSGGAERDGRVRLLQFPLVGDPHVVPPRGPDDDVPPARRGRWTATLAPELAEPGATCDRLTDVYALGGVLHALLTGRPPCADGAAATAARTAGGAGPPPLPETVPPPLRQVVARLMARDRRDRIASAEDAAAAVEAACGAGTPPPPPEPQGLQRIDPAVVTVGGALPGPGARPPRRAARGPRLPGWLVAASLLGIAGAVMVAWLGVSPAITGRGPAPRSTGPRMTPAVAAGGPSRAVDARVPAAAPAEPTPASGPAVPRVVDDQRLPWASPTAGPSPGLAYLPPGSRLVMLARPAAIDGDEEGRLFVRALGTEAGAAVARAVGLCGGDPRAIALLQAGWQAGESGELLVGLAAWFAPGHAAPSDEASRRSLWGETTVEQVAGETVHHADGLSFWIPASERGRVLVVAPRVAVPSDGPLATAADAATEPLIARMIRETSASAGDEADGPRAAVSGELETLVGMLDADRHLTLLGVPGFLLAAGRPLLAGPLAALAGPLDAWCGDAVRSAAVSLHFGESSYVELDAVAGVDVPARTLAASLAGRVEALPDEVEARWTAGPPDPHGRVLVLRLPAMLRVLAAQLRHAAEGDAAVLNAYLPRHAPHNVALAAEIALAQMGPPGGAAPPHRPTPRRAVDRLAARMTLTFAKESLERSIQAVSEEAGVPIEILGGDLEVAGITKNQSFSLDERDKTAAEILRAILVKAGPGDRLVAVVEERAGTERVVITTRAAAATRGTPLW